jgi:hypothetical protein
MRLVLRIIGTVLIALAVILVIIDGTKSLAANAIVFTSLGETWGAIQPDSLAAVREFLDTRLFGPLLDPLVSGLLSLPGWAIVGVPGILLAWAGRSRRERMFVRQDSL